MSWSASRDLRERVVGAYLRGEGSYSEIAERFDVGVASVSRWLRRVRETGSVAPKPRGGGARMLIQGELAQALLTLVLAHPDWSEAELTAEFRKQCELTVSEATVGRAIRRLGYSVKKSRPSRLSETAPTSSADESSTSSESPESPLRVWFLWTKRVRTSR